tara:strand:+ start:9953 stop:10684 length:732 start_codon:yes stop_codon:yes gene_type:complete
MKKPLVSVIIPVYNSSHTIANAIMSILTQTYKKWELIIVNDGSDDKDELQRVVMGFTDKRIKFIEIPHSGVVGAQMAGYKAAKGSLMTVQAADDLSLPNRLERAVQAFCEDDDLDVFVHSLYTNLWDTGHNCIIRGYREAVTTDPGRLLKQQEINGVPIFKKHVIRKCPLREETKDAYDWMQHLDWMYSDFKYVFSNEALYEYVRHENSLSERNEREGKRAKALEVIKEIMADEFKVKFIPKG